MMSAIAADHRSSKDCNLSLHFTARTSCIKKTRHRQNMQALPPVRREASTTDYPFPCLKNPEDELPANGTEDEEEEEEDDGVFGEGFDDDEIQKGLDQMRLSSVPKLKAGALSADGNALVDYDVHPQHRRDGKEALPSGTPGAQSGSYRSNFITPAVIGSLPKGLTMAEKAAVGSSVGMSPAAQRMQDIPELQASSATAAGIRFRRAVLRDSVVAYITAGYSGKRFVFEKAKDLGVRSIILDGPDSWSQTLVGEGLVERFVPIDFADAGTVVDRCMVELIKIRDEIGLDAVTTFNEFAVPLVARLAERLGLPGNPPSACDLARDKAATRKLMAAANLPSPKHMLIETSADVEKAADYVGFPAVIKPIAAAASMGVVRVDNLPELKAKVTATQKQLASLYLDEHGHLRESVEGQEIDAGQKAQVAQIVSNTLMMEEYLDGDEVDCDLVLWDGKCTYGAVTDNWPTIEPYFNETGSNCPSILSVSTQKELMDLAVASTQVLGFKLGVFHVELKATSRGPRLIEVNARMGGGGVRDINLLVWGVDLVEQHLLASCGLAAKPLIAAKPIMRLAEYSINAPVTGIVESVDFLEPWSSKPEVVYARPLVEVGERVVSVADGMPSWVCEVCVQMPTVREGIEYVKQIEKDIQYPIKPAKQ